MAVPLRHWKRALVNAIEQSGDAKSISQADVGLITVGLGDKGALIRAVLNDSDQLGYRAMVLGLMGGGHVPSTIAEDVGRLASLMPVVVAGRMGGGPMLRETYESAGMEIDLLRRGVIQPGPARPFKGEDVAERPTCEKCGRASIEKVFEACI